MLNTVLIFLTGLSAFTLESFKDGQSGERRYSGKYGRIEWTKKRADLLLYD